MIRQWIRVLAIVFVATGIAVGQPAETVRLTFDASVTHQTMEGWSVTMPCWGFDQWVNSETRSPAVYDATPDRGMFSDELNLAVAADLVERGFTRLRLEVGPQVELINDNDDPNTTNIEAFRYKWQDIMVREQYEPVSKLIRARGEEPMLYVSYDLRSRLTPEWLLQPEEYAEMAVTTLAYLKDKHGLEPVYWCVMNEPGNNRPGRDENLIAQLTAATGKRIAEAGFKTRMSGPEVVTPGMVTRYMEAMERTPGALDHFAQLTYHLYGVPDTVVNREKIRAWGRKLNVPVAMTEWCEQEGLDIARHIWLCLTIADAVTWERYGWGVKRDLETNTFTRKPTAWYVRQFSRFIRPGMVRVEMTSVDRAIKPVGYLSPSGKAVVVILNLDERHIPATIAGLPGGTYQVSFTNCYVAGESRDSIAIKAGDPLEISLPPRCALTLTADPPAAGPEVKMPKPKPAEE
jgi:hypothetical protein